MPADSIARVTASETSGTKSANTGDPNVVRTPAVMFRSLIAVGTPHSGSSAAGSSAESSVIRPAARSRASSGVRVTNAPDLVGPREVVVDQLER